MNLDVVLTRAAKADITAAAAWYRERSVSATEGFMLEVAAAIQRLATHPTAQPAVDATTGARRVIVKRYPYRVLYLVEETRAVVLAVVHIRRDESAWRGRLT